jgi:glycopeptide antibiotics resistance protein
MLLKSITFFWSLVILFLSLYPFKVKEDSIQLWQHTDKIVHFLMYALLTFFVLLNVKPKNWLVKESFIVVLSCILYGIVIEVIQEAMKLGRSFDFFDILANSAGVFCALTGYFILKKYKFFVFNQN